MEISDDEYHDYDEDDENESDSSEHSVLEEKLGSPTGKKQIGSVSPTVQIQTKQASFDSSFNSVENSYQEKTKITRTGETKNDKNNNHLQSELDLSKKHPKQISEVINDAIKTALQINIPAAPGTERTNKSPTNIDSPISTCSNLSNGSNPNGFYFGSITKGTPFSQQISPSSPKEASKLTETTKLNPTTTISASIATVINELTTNKEFRLAKEQVAKIAQPAKADKVTAFSVISDLISKQLQASTGKPDTPPKMPPPVSATTLPVAISNIPTVQTTIAEIEQHNSVNQSEQEKKYTLGKWVDTIIVKMNDPAIDEIDIDDPIRQSNFKGKIFKASFSKSLIIN